MVPLDSMSPIKSRPSLRTANRLPSGYWTFSNTEPEPQSHMLPSPSSSRPRPHSSTTNPRPSSSHLDSPTTQTSLSSIPTPTTTLTSSMNTRRRSIQKLPRPHRSNDSLRPPPDNHIASVNSSTTLLPGNHSRTHSLGQSPPPPYAAGSVTLGGVESTSPAVSEDEGDGEEGSEEDR